MVLSTLLNPPVVFLFDVDNTLLDNDQVTADLKRYLNREVGAACADRYWAIFEALRAELGYADYLGAFSVSASSIRATSACWPRRRS